MAELTRAEYARRYGPTTGDLVRLGDTDLRVRVERDDTFPGDEPTYGWGGTLRPRALQEGTGSASQMDALVVGGLVLDPRLGVVKTSIGIQDGRVVALGAAGGGGLAIGPHTDVVDATGLIVTPGAIDAHVHLITPAAVEAALASGVTTAITAGWEEPLWKLLSQLDALEHTPLNLAFQATVRAERPAEVERLATELGCPGLKVHEDFGASPELIDAALQVCEQHDLQLCIHTDGLGESTDLTGTVEAIAGRTVHAYHVEGAGGGHVDTLALVGVPNVLCSSTNPTLPFGAAALAEHPPMIALVHFRDLSRPDDAALVAERVREGTMAAEGPLHDLGAIQMITSDAQGMGRVGETVRRTWQLAHAMKRWSATADGARLHDAVAAGEAGADGADDNARVLRYLAKITLEPAIAHGIAEHVGGLAPGRLADMVLWRPVLFGAKPELVLKAGRPAWGAIGSGNATVGRAAPVRSAPHWAGVGDGAARHSVLFTSRAALEGDVRLAARTRRALVAVRGCRGLRREDMHANRACPPLRIDDAGRVTIHDREVRAEPVATVPLSRRYFL